MLAFHQVNGLLTKRLLPRLHYPLTIHILVPPFAMERSWSCMPWYTATSAKPSSSAVAISAFLPQPSGAAKRFQILEYFPDELVGYGCARLGDTSSWTIP